MTEAEQRVKALELAVTRNQKLSAQAGDVVNEAKIYFEFITNGLQKPTSGVKK
jgi:hypothetical protein